MASGVSPFLILTPYKSMALHDDGDVYLAILNYWDYKSMTVNRYVSTKNFLIKST
jgi:hypothetical protein